MMQPPVATMWPGDAERGGTEAVAFSAVSALEVAIDRLLPVTDHGRRRRGPPSTLAPSR